MPKEKTAQLLKRPPVPIDRSPPHPALLFCLGKSTKKKVLIDAFSFFVQPFGVADVYRKSLLWGCDDLSHATKKVDAIAVSEVWVVPQKFNHSFE